MNNTHMKTNSFIKCLKFMTRYARDTYDTWQTDIGNYDSNRDHQTQKLLSSTRGKYTENLQGWVFSSAWTIDIWLTHMEDYNSNRSLTQKNSALMCQLRISWLQLFTDHNQVPRDIGVGGVSLGRGRGKNFTKFQKQTLAKNNNCWFLSSPNRPWSVLTVNNFSV